MVINLVKIFVSLCVYVREKEKERQSKSPLGVFFQVLRLKEKYSVLDLIGRVLCSGSFKLCV